MTQTPQESRDQGTNAFGQMADELRLQAWLARAEFKNPSLHDASTKAEIDALASMRDQLRLQLHLGRMEMREEWHRLEDRWRALMHRAGDTVDDAAGSITDLIAGIREGYQALQKEHSDLV